jgi:hypothetical protein
LNCLEEEEEKALAPAPEQEVGNTRIKDIKNPKKKMQYQNQSPGKKFLKKSSFP